METTIYDSAAKSLAAQFVENTGRHILDSGGAYGRRFERLAGMTVGDFMAADQVTIDEYSGPSVSLFRVLVDHLQVTDTTRGFTQGFRDFVEASPVGEHYYNSAHSVADFVTGALRGDIVRHDNTYNFEHLADGDVQFVEFTVSGETYTAISTHNGADIRGGYSDFVVYLACDCWGYALTKCTLTCRKCDVVFAYCVWEGLSDVIGTPVDAPDWATVNCPECKGAALVGDQIEACFS